MQYILSLLPILACPVGMGLMMWFMMRANKQQTPGEVSHMPMQAYSQPPRGTEPSSLASPPKRTSTFHFLGMCLNWKILAGLAVVGLIVLVAAPQFIWAALPILILAACPLSMLLMMRGMSGNVATSPPSSMQGDQLSAVRMTRDEHQQEDITRQIIELGYPEIPVVPEVEAVAHAVQE